MVPTPPSHVGMQTTTLVHKRIVLAVTGSIAAYKTPTLVRLLVKAGAQVRVIMTADAKDFVTPLSLATVSKNEVLWSATDGNSWNNHVELGMWADALLVAPATANTLAKLANGLCDNMVCAVYLSAKCPVLLAPAMDLDMWKHPATQANIQQLITYGNQIIPVETGELASGLVGPGRMAEPEHIVTFVQQFLSTPSDNQRLRGKKVMITAGPTYEAIDPVRFIGNRSSGKMATALANYCVQQGASVHYITGPATSVPIGSEQLTVVSVQSAKQMLAACKAYHAQADISLFAAAVADYTPKEVATQKIKKSEPTLTIELVKNPDIAAELGAAKLPHQLHIGFALETHSELAHATAKLHKKNFDAIVLNSTNDAGATFGYDTNKITIIDRQGSQHPYLLKGKDDVAKDIIHFIADHLLLA